MAALRQPMEMEARVVPMTAGLAWLAWLAGWLMLVNAAETSQPVGTTWSPCPLGLEAPEAVA